MLSIQPTLSVGYHKNPEDEQQVFENMAVFFDRCDELEVPIYFTYDDIVNRTNLQHVLSTVCTYGEFALKSANRDERKGSLSLSSSSGPQTVSTSSSYPSPRDNNNSNEMEKDEGVEPVVVLQKEETPEEKREKQKRKQTMVLAELFETEKSFVADLELLVHVRKSFTFSYFSIFSSFSLVSRASSSFLLLPLSYPSSCSPLSGSLLRNTSLLP
jgi:hypothetical protein